MIIRQLSVFLENKPGRLSAAVDVLAENGVNISALSLADTSEYGILRLIVDQPEKAKEALSQTGVIVRLTHVSAIAMKDVPGGAGSILHSLSQAGLNIEYMYAFVGKVSGKALTVIRTDNVEKAEMILKECGHSDINPADIYRI